MRRQQLPDRNGRTYMMPGRIILKDGRQSFHPVDGIMSESETPGKPGSGLLCGRRRLFEFGDPVGADLIDDAAEFLDPFAEPRQFIFTDFIMF